MSHTKLLFSLSIALNIIFISFVSYKYYLRIREKPTRTITEDTYWLDKVSQYEILNKTQKGNILFIGDSMADRFRIEEFFPDQKIFGRGNAWDDTRSLLKRLDNTVLSGSPKKVLIYIGSNDILYNIHPNKTIANIELIINNLQANRISATVISLLPVFKENKRSNKTIKQLNHEIKLLCENSSTKYIDIYDKFLNHDLELRRELSTDGVHLNGQGYAILAEELSAFIVDKQDN